ncbi:hypothetical protein CASFOL_023765 [Castilleja foliolosa]|uniref:Uncharacterized protein n=1 Tax=Castilleja foliolosa TaxID=1961234 RepID=A0ABD3CN72_9LAMI
MAANLQSRGLASLGKRFVGQIQSRDSVVAPFTLRGVHTSVYDKNPDESVHSSMVPDHVMPLKTEEYWAPHPKTGVFGPAKDARMGSGQDSGVRASAGAESVLEAKAFFRPQEDLEKPPVQVQP